MKNAHKNTVCLLLHECQKNHQEITPANLEVIAIRADKYAKSLLDKDILSFWKHIGKSDNARVPLATTIGGITGENEIAEMWQDHYKSIYIKLILVNNL